MSEPVPRPTVRVLLLDDQQRLLLFRSRDTAGAPFWFPPGGAVEGGETPGQAARREVREETGFVRFRLGPEVWRRRHVADVGGVTYDFRERWFLAWVPSGDTDMSDFTAAERRRVTAHQWWDLDELSRTSERLVPRSLAWHLRMLLRDGPPAKPIDVGN